MKLVAFSREGSVAAIGALTERGVVRLMTAEEPQAAMARLIDRFTDLKPSFETLVGQSEATPLGAVRLLPPLPRPGKILCSTADYAATHAPERSPLLMTLKSPESVIGPQQTVYLPDVGDGWQFLAQAELGLVIRGPAKHVQAVDWRSAVFGYTTLIDVMASGDTQFGRDFWLAKADTLAPIGPCIVTADEIDDPAALRVRSRINGAAAQDYAIADADYAIGEQIAFATTVMTLYSGDVVACGTSHAGLRPLMNGDTLEVAIAPALDQLQVRVATVSAAHA